jgi:hypothetical protein
MISIVLRDIGSFLMIVSFLAIVFGPFNVSRDVKWHIVERFAAVSVFVVGCLCVGSIYA